MAILEASGKQEPEAKEAPAGPLEEVRVCSPSPSQKSPHPSYPHQPSLRGGAGETAAPYPRALSAVCLRMVSIFSPTIPLRATWVLGPSRP